MQQASPTVSPPAVTTQPQVAAPQAPTAATPPTASLPGQPVPMATPVAPDASSGVPVTSIAPPAIASVPEAAAPRAARTPVRTAAPPAPATVAEPTPAPVEAAPAPVETNSEPEAAAPIATAPTQPEPAVADSGDSNGEVWGWMAALLAALGIGGGAIALRRTRTRKSASDAVSAPVENHPETAPVMVSRQSMAGPHDRPVAPAPMYRASPQVRATTGDHSVEQRQLEQMIAQRPSRENPFVTRPNRKRRALFLLRNRYPMQTAA